MNARHSRSRLSLFTVVLCFAATMSAGCGGGSSGSSPPPPPPPVPTTISGVAAAGAPLADATVTVVAASVTTSNPAPVTTAKDGSYTVDVSGLRPPLAIRVVSHAWGVPHDYMSLLVTVAANAGNTANVTPLTNAVAALVSPTGDPLYFLAPAALGGAAPTGSKVDNAVALLTNTLKTDPAIASKLGATFNPMTTAFSADGTGLDAVLDQLSVTVVNRGVKSVQIVNLWASVLDVDAPRPVLLTGNMVQPPQPPLPSTAPLSDMPSAADIEGFRVKLQECMALPVAQRVTLDSSGKATSVSAPCAFAEPDWRSNGRNWVEQMGQFSFSKAQLNNTIFGRGVIALALSPANRTDPKEFKHPYCNSGPCVIVRYPATVGGLGDTWDFQMGKKINGSWGLVGNQRPYDLFVQTRSTQYIAVNDKVVLPVNPADAYFYKDRFESQLRVMFSPSGLRGDFVRAVRMTGPGLPTAGLVFHRSSRCGTDDRFPITNQTGSLRRPSDNAVVTFNNNGGVDFTLDAANPDRTPLTMPAPAVGGPGFSPAPLANLSALIPAWARYKAEIFWYSNTTTPDVPDEIVYTRTDSEATNAAEDVDRGWPGLQGQFANDYLKPNGSGNGTLAATPPVTVNWQASPGSVVRSAYLFSQNFVSAMNTNGFTSSYGKRTRLDFEPTSYGNASAPSTTLASVVSGASLVASTANTNPNPNPRCTDRSLVPLTTDPSDYREAGLFVHVPGKNRMDKIYFWKN